MGHTEFDAGPLGSATAGPGWQGPGMPLLYSEDDLETSGEAGPRPRMPSVVNDLIAARTGEERQRLVRGMLHAIGFAWLGYGSVAQQHGKATPLTFFTSYAHPEWTQRYFSQRYHDLDTRHHDAPCSSLPLVWDLDDLKASDGRGPMAGRKRRFLDELADCGIGSGVFFSLASPTRVQERTVISLMSSAPNRRWIMDSVLGQALTLALSVHEYLSQHRRLPETHAGLRAEMPPMQQHILNFLIQGQSDKEIAYQLQLSAHTVDYHMRQLRRRFSVRNRVQLVKAAMQAVQET
ncbi:hypothetical protein AAW51_5375 [Caldimonas brevitalea]|uniref:HTH luxR-type domain-containing protein n=1 Tax=Caldimonas brevitalea TaxID=413882 RepID=A0A0G3BXG8_9BURK|nr:hypothetical protein AAW51_5375 [Caldimonas brevitalea]